jgi:hypothetical protein
VDEEERRVSWEASLEVGSPVNVPMRRSPSAEYIARFPIPRPKAYIWIETPDLAIADPVPQTVLRPSTKSYSISGLPSSGNAKGFHLSCSGVAITFCDGPKSEVSGGGSIETEAG